MVVVVCDGAHRHHTKRASIQQQLVYFGNKVKSYLLCFQLISILEKKKSEVDSIKKDRFEAEEIFASTELKKLETKSQRANVDVGQKFFTSLEEHVKKILPAALGKKGGEVTVLQAEYRYAGYCSR